MQLLTHSVFLLCQDVKLFFNENKQTKSLEKSVKEFSRRFDLVNAKLMSVSEELLQELPKLHILLRLSIFVKCPTGKFIHARWIKIIENLHFFAVFFSIQHQNKVYCPFFNTTTVKLEVCCPFFFAEFSSQMSYLLMRLQMVQIT